MKNTHTTTARTALRAALDSLYGTVNTEQACVQDHQLDLILRVQGQRQRWTGLTPIGLTVGEAIKHLASGTASHDGPTAAQVAEIANRELARLLGPRAAPAPMTTRTYTPFGMITEEKGGVERLPSVPEQRRPEETHHVRYDSRAEISGESRKVLTVTSTEIRTRRQVSGGTHDVTRTDCVMIDGAGKLMGSVSRGCHAEQLVLRDNDPAFREQIRQGVHALFGEDLDTDTSVRTVAVLVDCKLSFADALAVVRNLPLF